ncbi:MAG: hypothetical protein IKC32_05615 [Clostridia bacterium]|nr:hypothetical protein [Clostridia bacterium]
MADTADIGSIVSMIMENPTLISEIKKMADNRSDSDGGAVTEEVVAEAPSEERTEPAHSISSRRKNRITLANAMKPYLSEERARAIDAMISIADILDVTRGKI